MRPGRKTSHRRTTHSDKDDKYRTPRKHFYGGVHNYRGHLLNLTEALFGEKYGRYNHCTDVCIDTNTVCHHPKCLLSDGQNTPSSLIALENL